MIECKTHSKISRNSLSLFLLPHSAANVRSSYLANIPERSLVLSFRVSAAAVSCLSQGLHQAGGFNLSGSRSGFSSAGLSCRFSTPGDPQQEEPSPCLPPQQSCLSFALLVLIVPYKLRQQWVSREPFWKIRERKSWEKSPTAEWGGVGMRRWRKKDGDWEYWHIYTTISLLLVTYILWFNLHQSLWGRWDEPRVTKKEIRLREVN